MTWIEEVKAARKEGSFDKAMSVLSAELSKRPFDAVVHYQIAWTHDALGKERDAAPAYENAIELGLKGDDLLGAYLGLGSTCRCLGLYQKSLDVFERAIALFPEYRAFRTFQSLALHNIGDHGKAIEILIRQLAETSTDESIQKYQRALLFYADKLNEVFE